MHHDPEFWDGSIPKAKPVPKWDQFVMIHLPHAFAQRALALVCLIFFGGILSSPLIAMGAASFIVLFCGGELLDKQKETYYAENTSAIEFEVDCNINDGDILFAVEQLDIMEKKVATNVSLLDCASKSVRDRYHLSLIKQTEEIHTLRLAIIKNMMYNMHCSCSCHQNKD